MAKSQKPRPSGYSQTCIFIGPPDWENFDGSVDADKLMNALRRSPAVFDLMRIQRLVEHGILQPEYHDQIIEIVTHLSEVIKRAGTGDEKAKSQLKAITKIVQPDKYQVPFTKIREIVDRYETEPALARGWELRKLMVLLSAVVKPSREIIPYSPDQPIRVISDAPKNGFDLSVWETAKKHWKPNATLQSLAIRVYLAHLHEQGISDENNYSITQQTLKRDLAKVREWEETATEDEKDRRGLWYGKLPGGNYITWCEYSDGWKERKKARKTKG